ncbi:hypothetical protein AC579_2425 [Pseudocercospora musae]|uniref:MaoC-like domain-containing protein n=1 Tax=Pseudocercospora musae TaxID=113226 RepID=A0A139IBM0_9PEZI|nr:hypothetical protein AC579_2425 [Pseudocercospora musae]
MLGLIRQSFRWAVSLVGALSLLLTRYPETSRGSGAAYINLTKSPNQIGAADIISLIVLAFLKYIPGYASRLRANGSSQTLVLPQIRAEGILRIDQQAVETFKKSLRADGDSEESEVNPFFLVAQSVPLIIYFLVNRACPIKPFGAVNTRNIIHVLQPASCRDAARLQQVSEEGRLTYISSIGGEGSPGRRRKRGVEFCITIEIYAENELLMQQQCWFLQFLPASSEPRYRPEDELVKKIAAVPEDSLKAEFSLPMTLQDALRWAATSKDYDGIHVSPLVAKLFGFQGALAHGNHVAALAVQQLQSTTTASDTNAHEAAHNASQKILWQSDGPFTIDISFVRPAMLPAILAVQWHCSKSDASKAKLTVLRHGKVCIEGSCFINT